MYIYFVLLFFLLLFWILNIPAFANNNSDNPYIKTINWLFVSVIYFILALLSYFRGINVGTDYSLYYSFYESGLFEDYFDPFIVIIFNFAVHLDEFRFITLISTGVFLTVFFMLQKKYAYSIVNFTFLFVTTFVFFFFLNGLRQAVAMSVLWIGLMKLGNKSKKDVFFLIIIIIIAAQIHISAYFTFVFLIVKYFSINKRMVLIGLLIVTIGFFTNIVKGSLGEVLMQVDFYSQKYSNNLDFFFQQNKEKGMLQFFPILIQFIFLFIWISWKDLKGIESNKLIENYYFLYLLFFTASGIEAVDRFQVYLYPSVIFFYDLMLFKMFRSSKLKREKIIVCSFSLIIVIFWVIYYSLRIAQNTNGLVPYSVWGNFNF